MENSCFFENKEIGLYPEFESDALKYFSYLKTLYSGNICQILEGTNEFSIAKIPRINGESFYFKLEIPRVKNFDEII